MGRVAMGVGRAKSERDRRRFLELSSDGTTHVTRPG